MRLPHITSQRSIQFNMTPLIDVVFLLIIFFLVSSHLARQETQLDLDLPLAASGEELAARNHPRVTINVLPDGQIWMGSSAAAPQELARRLNFERQRASDELEVRIRGDRSVPFERIEPILLACAESGIWNVSFAVVESTKVRKTVRP